MKACAVLDLILVNWNAGPQLVEAIASIAQHHHNLVSSVIIVDNASTDNSLSHAESLSALPFELRIIHNTENQGFGAACNQGAALSSSEFMLFLNPDTRLFKKSLLAPMDFMRRPENMDVGIVGIQLVDEDGKISRSCARSPLLGIFVMQALGLNRLPGLHHWSHQMVEWGHETTQHVDQVMGAFFLIRRTLFEYLGGFDERFFVYYEEVDLCLRAQKVGWHILYFAEAQAFHAGGGTSRQVKAVRLFYSLRSRLFYGFKHFSVAKAWFLLLITLILEPWSRIGLALLRGSWRDVYHTLQGYWMLIGDLPSILRASLGSK